MAAGSKKRVLILCTGNSCRSQMAEGLWRSMADDEWEVCSAGSEPAGFLHPLAIEVMRERGVDISGQSSKHLREFMGQEFDLIITVCDGAEKACPSFPGKATRLHWPFDDPARETGDAEPNRRKFRRVRDEIAEQIVAHLEESL